MTGGARSGKTAFALGLAAEAEKPYYLATGWAGDGEMRERIRRHREERGDRWTTIEETTDIARALEKAFSEGADFILADCLTLWVSNMMADGLDPVTAIEKLMETLPPVDTAFVANELGSGIVPADSETRRFRDLAGFVNQIVAAKADEVWLAVAGIPVRIKPA